VAAPETVASLRRSYTPWGSLALMQASLKTADEAAVSSSLTSPAGAQIGASAAESGAAVEPSPPEESAAMGALAVVVTVSSDLAALRGAGLLPPDLELDGRGGFQPENRE